MKAKREHLIVAGFVALSSLFFLTKPFHMDEPLFLAPARHIALDPAHPFDFSFNWYGRAVPMSTINNTPPLMLYALALAWKMTGGNETAMRLLFVPANVAAAAALYLLASLFLSEPLWPTLALVAAPAYLIDMNLLYPETLALPLGFLGLFFLVSSRRTRDDKMFWISAGLIGLSVFAKYGAVFLIPTAVLYLWTEKTPAKKIAAHVAVAAAPIALYLVYDRLTYHAAVSTVWTALAQGAGVAYGGPVHRLRALLTFIAGGAAAAVAWPFFGTRDFKKFGPLAIGVLMLFLPSFDAAVVRSVDRATGDVLAFAAVAALWTVWSSRGSGRNLWLAWIVSGIFVQLVLYWSVVARVVLYFLPAVVFGLAEVLETRFKSEKLKRVYAATFVVSLLFTGGLAFVDARYAAAQKNVAAHIAERFPGKRLWCAGHWGLQFYMEQAGARELDFDHGGWDEVRPGDVVVVPLVNSNIIRPRTKLKANVDTIDVDASFPLRLISGVSGEGGFYSSATGFLPFSVSREPLERFEIVEVLP